MIRRCAWHLSNFGQELIMGEKEPLQDKGFTDGICQDCLEKELGIPTEEQLAEKVASLP